MTIVSAEVIGADEVAARIRSWIGLVRDATITALAEWSEDLRSYIVENKLSGDPLKRHTGRLSGSIRPYAAHSDMRWEGGAAGGNGVPYARPLEDGSKPHEIVPVRARMLRFMVGGNVVFAHRVHHPGNRPYRYMESSLQENAADGIERVKAAVLGAINE